MQTSDSKKHSDRASSLSLKGSDLSGVVFKTTLAMVMAGLVSTGYSMENSPSLQKATHIQDSREQVVSIYSSSPENPIVQTDTFANLKSISSDSFSNPDRANNASEPTPRQYKDQALSYLAKVIDAGAFKIETPISSIQFKDTDEVLNGDPKALGIYKFLNNGIELKSNHRAHHVLLHEVGHHFMPKGQAMREQLQRPSAQSGPNALDGKERLILEHIVGKPGTSSVATSIADWGELSIPSKLETLVGPNAFRKARSSHMHHEWLAESFRMYSMYKLGGLDEVVNQMSDHLYAPKEISPEEELRMPNRQRIAMANLIETLVRHKPSELEPIKEDVIPDVIRQSMQRSIVDQHMFDRSVQLNLFLEASDGSYSPATEFQNYRGAQLYFAREIANGGPLLKIDKNTAMAIYDPQKEDVLILSKDGSISYNLSKEVVDNPSLSEHLKNFFPLVTQDPGMQWNKGIFDLEKIELIQQEAYLQRIAEGKAKEIDSQAQDFNSESVSESVEAVFPKG